MATPASRSSSPQVLAVAGRPYLRSSPWSAHLYCSWPGRPATKALSCTVSKASQMASSVCSCSMSRFILREPGNRMGSLQEGRWVRAGPSCDPTSAHPAPRPHLGDDGDPGPQCVQPHVDDGDPVDPDPALSCLQEPQQAPSQGGLPSPRPANNAHLPGDGRARPS